MGRIKGAGALARGAAGLGLSLAGPGQAQPAPGGCSLSVTIAGLRSDKGMVRACLTGNPAYFPNCDKDPAALHLSVPAAGHARLDFEHVPAGDYALSVLHDENGNAKIDTFLGIPREGVGFSRNPKLAFGPPKWAEVSMRLTGGETQADVKMLYFL
jgi:uncharacterized protein (DUF2141 family)